MRQKTDLTPGRVETDGPVARKSTSGDVAAFLKHAKATTPRVAGARGRLVFALDATMSRQPTWDLACNLQASMFDAAFDSENR